MPTFNLPSEITYIVQGQSYTHSLENHDADMILRGFIHGMRQYIGDAAAGKESDAEKAEARNRAFSARTEWLRSESRTRAGLPQADTLFLSEARLWLRAKGVASKIVAALKTREDALLEISLVVEAALKAKGSSADPTQVAAAVANRIEETVKTRLAAASADIEV